jgi:hypothetical protein
MSRVEHGCRRSRVANVVKPCGSAFCPINCLLPVVAGIETGQATNRKDAAGGNINETCDAASSYPLMRRRARLSQ